MEMNIIPAFSIRPVSTADKNWIRKRIIQTWRAEIIVVHGRIFTPSTLPGFIAEISGKPVGLLTYEIAESACEIVTLESWANKRGIGSALINAVKEVATQNSCRKMWVVTTNDNTTALRFYQKLGFTIACIRIDEVYKARSMKPQIPLVGLDGITIRDEIELEMKITIRGE